MIPKETNVKWYRTALGKESLITGMECAINPLSKSINATAKRIRVILKNSEFFRHCQARTRSARRKKFMNKLAGPSKRGIRIVFRNRG